MSILVVERLLSVTTPSGDVFETSVGLRDVEQVGDFHWRCIVDLGRIKEEPRSAFGVDSWHVFQAGMQMVFVELNFKKCTGWKFNWLNGEEEDLQLLLPAVGRLLPHALTGQK